MNVKIKSSLILTVTLILGIVIGAVGSGMLRNYIFEKRMEKFRSPKGFINYLEQVIQPEPSQRAELREKLESQRQRFMQLSMKFRTEMDSLNVEFQKELDGILTEEQQQRLSKFLESRKRQFHERGRHMPPPPPPPDK
jgi:translation initiation factor 2B subunit (eIF-2B alpha/beta/delta family)